MLFIDFDIPNKKATFCDMYTNAQLSEERLGKVKLPEKNL